MVRLSELDSVLRRKTYIPEERPAPSKETVCVPAILLPLASKATCRPKISKTPSSTRIAWGMENEIEVVGLNGFG